MSSTPPTPRGAAPLPVPRLTGDPSTLDDGVLYFAVEGAPRESVRTTTSADAGLEFRTELAGVLTHAGSAEWHLSVGPRTVTVQHLLPSWVDLGELVGRAVHLRVVHRYLDRGRATIQAELRDADGRLLLWARDGRMPRDGELPGLSVRAALSPASPPRVLFATERAVVGASVPGRAALELDGAPFEAAPLRLGADDLSLLLVRR